MTRRQVVWMIVVLACAGLPACSHLVTAPPAESTHTVGTITQVPSRLGTYAFLIEERPEQPVGTDAGPFTSGDKYHVAVTGATRIQRRAADGSVRDASAAEIAVGMWAEVWFVGPILESYPAQGTAGRILILAPAP